MIKKVHYYMKKLIIFLIVLSFFSFTAPELLSAAKKTKMSYSSIKKSKKKKRSRRYRRRRSYNPELTRSQSIELIRSSSEEVSALAGLEPKIDPYASTAINNNTDDDELDDTDNTEEQISDEGEEGENLDELEKEDDVPVDIESFKMLWLSFVDDGEDDEYTAGGISKKDIMSVIMDWLGTPYRFGGRSEKAIDCSAFIQRVFKETCEITLPRTARTQINVGIRVSREKLEFGDMIFFYTYSRKFASHVGIYLGDNLFAHASSKYGVTVSSLESTFYNNRFIEGRRLSVGDILRFSSSSSDSSNQ